MTDVRVFISICHLLISPLYYSYVVTGSPPGVPRIVRVTSVGANLLVQWHPPARTYGHILQYQVIYNVLPDMHDVTMTTDEQTFVLIPVADHPGRLYRITVLAENSQGLSRPSNPRYIRVTFGCGGKKHVLPETSVIVTSSFYPKRLEPSAVCKWDISTNTSFVLKFEIEDIDFNDESCTKDFIKMTGLDVNYEQKLCNKSKSQFVSEGNWTSLTLHTGSSGSGRGFKVRILSIVPVPEQPANVKVAAFDKAIKVTWAPPVDYNVNYITAYRVRYFVFPSSRTLVVTLSARRRSFVISTRGHEGQLYVVKVSVMHQFQEGPPSSPFYVNAACSTNIVLQPNSIINITSPGYPGNYSPHVLCHWKITSGSGRPFYFRMISMEIEESLYCNSDYASVSLWGNNRRCGVISSPEQFALVSGELTLTFVTDFQHEAAGFLAEVKSDLSHLQQTVKATVPSEPRVSRTSPLASVNTIAVAEGTHLSEEYLTSMFKENNGDSSSEPSTIVTDLLESYNTPTTVNITRDVEIQLLLQRRKDSTAETNIGKHIEQRLLNKLINAFNTTRLFRHVTISNIGPIGLKKPVPVSIVVNYSFCGLVAVKHCEPSFSLMKHINVTSLQKLTSHPVISEGWEIDPVYLQTFRTAISVENQELNAICNPLRDVCGDYRPCEDNIDVVISSLGQSRDHEMSSPTSFIIAVVVICLVLISSCAVLMKFRKYKHDRRKIHMSIEDNIRSDVDKFSWFINDTAALEKRLRMKRVVRRGNSF
ncbi:uncharacterized protein LOC132565123 [Ylistrum balloti]|uniref:uncharacterized protein LOC132565123 n=1 Tax=Ylistrum balloti TaxID=509963 RepID=UPI00290593D3|nr:uncharacterized protein LOC132565123 [Ylistrum balloti]